MKYPNLKHKHLLISRKHFTGSVIGQYTGELITNEEFSSTAERNHEQGLCNYFYATCTSMKIDAGPMGNHTRFINHDCRENCVTKGLTANEIIIVAAKNIKQGDELLLN